MDPREVDLFCRERVFRTGLQCEEMLARAEVEALRITEGAALRTSAAVQYKPTPAAHVAAAAPSPATQWGTRPIEASHVYASPHEAAAADMFDRMASFNANERQLLERIRKASRTIRQMPSDV